MRITDLFKKKDKREQNAPSWPYAARKILSDHKEASKRRPLDDYFPKGKTISFYIITVIACVLTAVYAIVNCAGAYTRLGEAIRDLGVSMAYYGTLIFPFYEIEPTLNEIPTVAISFLPKTWELFVELLNKWWKAIFVPEHFKAYLIEVALLCETLLPWIVTLAPFAILIGQIPDIILEKKDVEWLSKTKALKLFENLKYRIYFPVKRH